MFEDYNIRELRLIMFNAAELLQSVQEKVEKDDIEGLKKLLEQEKAFIAELAKASKK